MFGYYNKRHILCTLKFMEKQDYPLSELAISEDKTASPNRVEEFSKLIKERLRLDRGDA